jgi:hypothetical protein
MLRGINYQGYTFYHEITYQGYSGFLPVMQTTANVLKLTVPEQSREKPPHEGGGRGPYPDTSQKPFASTYGELPVETMSIISDTSKDTPNSFYFLEVPVWLKTIKDWSGSSDPQRIYKLLKCAVSVNFG